MPAERILLVRHGSYNHDNEKLTDEGQGQSVRAGEECLGILGPDAVVLSSPRLRAMETAGVIADVMSMDRSAILASPRIGYFGESEQGLHNLDDTISKALEEAGFTQEDPFGLIVVTHQPLIDMARKSVHKNPVLPFNRTKNGQVFEYEPGTWVNPYFADYKETVANNRIEAELAAMAQAATEGDSTT